MKQNLALMLSAGLATMFAGCGGGGSESGAYCSSINGGRAELAASCAGCTIDRQTAAVDGNLDSAAAAVATTGGANPAATLRATAQPGIVYPAGSNAGVFFTPYSNVCDTCSVTISTYLDGVLQESRSGVSNSTGSGSKAAVYSAVNALRPFNAVEIVASGLVAPPPTGSGRLVDVYEICSDGGFR